MKNFLKTTLTLLAVGMAAAGFSSCDSDDDDFKIAGPFYDFASVKSYTNSTVLLNAFIPNSNNELALEATYLNIVSPDEFPAGTRVLMTYNTNSQLNDGLPSETTKVQLIGLTKALTLTPAETATDDCTTGTFEGRMYLAPYRTGTFINFLMAANDLGPRAQFEALVDKASLATQTPHIYIKGTPGEGNATDDNSYPISVDIASLWNNETYQAIVIHIKSYNYVAQEFTIKK